MQDESLEYPREGTLKEKLFYIGGRGSRKKVRKKHTHNKPVGEAGPIRVTHKERSPIVERRKITLPLEKAAQKREIAQAFIKALNARDEAH
jgi:hypothetical protein